jgi:hypothetical protein
VRLLVVELSGREKRARIAPQTMAAVVAWNAHAWKLEALRRLWDQDGAFGDAEAVRGD